MFRAPMGLSTYVIYTNLKKKMDEVNGVSFMSSVLPYLSSGKTSISFRSRKY
jgi:hypothetical protein